MTVAMPVELISALETHFAARYREPVPSGWRYQIAMVYDLDGQIVRPEGWAVGDRVFWRPWDADTSEFDVFAGFIIVHGLQNPFGLILRVRDRDTIPSPSEYRLMREPYVAQDASNVWIYLDDNSPVLLDDLEDSDAESDDSSTAQHGGQRPGAGRKKTPSKSRGPRGGPRPGAGRKTSSEPRGPRGGHRSGSGRKKTQPEQGP